MSIASTKEDLLKGLKDREYREAFNAENVYMGIASQIRVLREQRDLSQSQLGRKANMAQERISILEDWNAGTKPTLNTLLRIASAFDVGLDVKFVSFGTVLDRAVNTNEQSLQVKSFEEESVPEEISSPVPLTVVEADAYIMGTNLLERIAELPYSQSQIISSAYAPKTRLGNNTVIKIEYNNTINLDAHRELEPVSSIQWSALSSQAKQGINQLCPIV